MMILVVGATGATGRLLVKQLLERGQTVRAIVRAANRLPADIRNHDRLSAIEANLLDLNDDELTRHVSGCEAVASCLGHNLTLKGVYGRPHRLVTDATRRLCGAIRENRIAGRTKFVLMNTAGNQNRDLDEPISFAQKCVIGLIRVLVPPHPDNEQAADYLRTQIGQHDPVIEWVAVRPDTLTDEDRVGEYSAQPSPTRSAIFDPGKVSRMNVADFMARLITDAALWDEWKGRVPVLYNREGS
jgi:nucleoside-diphosphate-sugar epimerase